MHTRMLLLLTLIAVATVGIGLAMAGPRSAAVVTTFDECAKHYPVMESYPRQCRTPDGQLFVEDIGNELEKQDLIRIDSPRPNQIVASPLQINGEARGNWYFEAVFAVELLDGNEQLLAQVPVHAQGEWMTTNFVPFSGSVEFAAPATDTGTLLLRKNNPSGLPHLDDDLHIPIRFTN